MSLIDCMNRAVRAGLMDRERAQFVRQRLGEIENDMRRDGVSDALTQAREKLVGEVSDAVQADRRVKVKQIQAQRSALGYVTEKGEGDLSRGLYRYTREIEARNSLFNTKYLSMIPTVMRELGHNVRTTATGGARNADLEDKFIREVFGESTGDDLAKQMAKEWNEFTEASRQDANRFGAIIRKRDDFNFTQIHDRRAVQATNVEDWVNFTMDRLDPARMKDATTGRALSPAEVRNALYNIHGEIGTDGWNGRDVGSANRGKSLGKKHLDSRFLVFKDATAWREYQEQFGKVGIFDNVHGHLTMMARDNASLSHLGPNPQSTLKFLSNAALKEANIAPVDFDQKRRIGLLMKREGHTKNRIANALAMYEHHSGAAGIPANEMVANGSQSLRNTLTAGQLGGAMLSALGDFGLAKLASDRAGVKYRRVLNTYRKAISSPEFRQRARESGLIAEAAAGAGRAATRYAGEISGNDVTSRMASSVLNVSGLTGHTDAMRAAFTLEWQAELARGVKGEPSRLMRRKFDQYGITAGDWQRMSQTELFEEEDGLTLLRPMDIEDADLAFKLQNMIFDELNRAVPVGTVETRALLLGRSQSGTFGGEFARFLSQYKTFPVSVVIAQAREMMAMDTPTQVGMYAAKMTIMSTSFGAMSLWAKDVARGREPRKFSPAFVTAALVQGGGYGIVGDFLFHDYNRYGNSLAATLAGPAVGFGEDVFKLTVGNISEAVSGEDTNVGKEAVDFIQRNTPGNNLWYARAAFERLIFDQIKKIADPNAEANFRKMERAGQERYGADYLWRPGELAPNFLGG